MLQPVMAAVSLETDSTSGLCVDSRSVSEWPLNDLVIKRDSHNSQS